MERFTWVNIYNKIAHRLLEYRENSKALADLMYEILEDAGLMYSEEKGSNLDYDGIKRCRYDEFDPISFMNRFEMYSDDNRKKFIEKFEEKTGLDIDIPKDFDGLPSTNPRKSCVIRFKDGREVEDVPNIWKLFDISLNGNFGNIEDKNKFIEAYNKVISKPCAKFNISIGLFKIRPDIFLNLDSTNRNFIEKRLGLKIRNCPDGKEYLEIIDKVKEYINNKFSTMLEFSYEAWKSRKNYDTKYWVYAPGENASLWKECIKNDIMVLGWDKIGNYNQYKDIDAVYEAIKKEYKTDNPKNDKLAVWNFKNDMSDGDVVIAKNGIYKVLGYGIVESDYYYDDSRKFYKNVRKVHWIKTGEWKLTDKDPLWSLPQKTLTEFTYYEKDIEKIMNLMEEDIQMENRKYFWLNANPKIWSFSELKVGDTINYTVINKNGNKRRIYKNFVEAKKGDLVIAYESYPTKKVVGLCEIDNELKDNELSIRKIEDLINPVEYNEIKNIKELENMEYFKSQQGSLFKLTKEEYDILMDLIRDNNPIEEIFNKNKKEYSKEKFLEKVYVKEEDYNELTELLLRKKNIILQGAPGVGKTFMAKRLAYSIIGYKDDTKIKFIQFHQSYSYEDFIEGWRPSEDGFKIEEGVFYKFCKEARRDSDNKYFFIIDEINRGNLSKIFGELLMLIEDDKREKK